MGQGEKVRGFEDKEWLMSAQVVVNSIIRQSCEKDDAAFGKPGKLRLLFLVSNRIV